MTTAPLRRPATRTRLSAEHLADPPRTDRPGTRWWWQSPTPVTELFEELRAIAAAGFGSSQHPPRPIRLPQPNKPRSESNALGSSPMRVK